MFLNVTIIFLCNSFKKIDTIYTTLISITVKWIPEKVQSTPSAGRSGSLPSGQQASGKPQHKRTPSSYDRHSVGPWSGDASARRTNTWPRPVKRLPADLHSLEHREKVRLWNFAVAGETKVRCVPVPGPCAVSVPGRSCVFGRNESNAGVLPWHWISVSAIGKSADVLFVFVDGRPKEPRSIYWVQPADRSVGAAFQSRSCVAWFTD